MLLPLWYAVFLLSVTCHEAGHAWAAMRGGDPTAYLGGQVSLNPVPHIRREMFGTVLIPFLTYFSMHWMMGWASAPYDPDWEDRHPRRAALMAAAGPVANLLLALIGFIALRFGLTSGIWVPAVELSYDRLVDPAGPGAGHWNGLGRLLSVLLSLNTVLFVFNLIPLPPLDGASILAGLFEPARRLRDRMRANAMVGLLGLLVAWFTFPRIFVPVYRYVLYWLFP